MDLKKEVDNFLLGITSDNKGYFVGTTDKNSLEYIVGETITFKIRVKVNGSFVKIPYIYCILHADDGQKTEMYEKCADDGWFYINTTLKKEGFVHLTAKACDENKKELEFIDTYEGGAGADIHKLSCGTEIPSDYFEFWDELKKKTYKVKPDILYKNKIQNSDYPNFKIFDMRIKTTDDMYASFIVTYPKDAKEGSLKLQMTYRGYGVARVPTNACADDRMIVSVNAHGIPNLEKDEFYDNLRENELKEYGYDNYENKNPQTTYWAKMFMRNMQVFAFLKEHPLLNKKDYIFQGASQGGMQACNMALHTGAATECELVIPWFADMAGYRKFARIKGCRPDYEPGLAYFDTALAARYLKCPIKITAGLGDYVCPPSGQMAMYNGISAPVELTFIQNKVHSKNPVEEITYILKKD